MRTNFCLNYQFVFHFLSCETMRIKTVRKITKRIISVLFVVNVRDIFIPASAASQALSVLFRRRTGKTFLRNSRRCQAKTLGNRRGRLALDHEGRKAHRQVFGETSVPLHELGNVTVFPCREPKTDVRKAFGNVGDLLQMLHALHVAAIMPAEEAAGFGHRDCKNHRLFPKRVEERLEPPLKSGLHVREGIASLQGVAFRTDRTDHVAELHAGLASPRGNRPRMTGHLRRFRKVADDFQRLSKCHHGKETSRVPRSLQVFCARFLRESSPRFRAFQPTKSLTRRAISGPKFFFVLVPPRSSAGF